MKKENLHNFLYEENKGVKMNKKLLLVAIAAALSVHLTLQVSPQTAIHSTLTLVLSTVMLVIENMIISNWTKVILQT